MPVIRLVKVDIVTQQVDAIVNSANNCLLGGGGTADRGRMPSLHAILTRGYKLRTPYVNHAVGSIWRDGIIDETQLSAGYYSRCFEVVHTHGLQSIGIPSISTGANGFPIDEACRIALRETTSLSATEISVNQVRFVLFSDSDL